MTSATATAMDGIDIAEFLNECRTGVVSLAKDDDAYAIPVSFTYQAETQDVYLRLGFAPGSQKREYIDAVDTVSFVVYDQTSAGWKSVVAQGHIEELSETTLDSAVVERVRDLDIPFFKVFDRPVDDLEFSVVRIDVTSLNGVVEGGAPRSAGVTGADV